MTFWSKFLKFIKSQNDNAVTKENNELSAKEKEEIEEETRKLTEELNANNLDNLDSIQLNRQKADILTKLGQDYQKLDKVDKAIAAYEKSLKLNEDFGPSFTGLLKLYDVKRQEAAYAKNNDEIQKWLNRADELTALSKKIMRSK